jgi:hypothetical protein
LVALTFRGWPNAAELRPVVAFILRPVRKFSVGGVPDGIAGRLQLGHVLVVEKVEALGQQLQLAHVPEVEAPAQPQIGLPGGRIAKGVAPDIVGVTVVAEAVDPVVAARAVHSWPQSYDSRAGGCVEFFRQ